MLKQLIARLYIVIFSTAGLTGSSIMGIFAGIGCYNENHILLNAIILTVMLAVLMFFPLLFLTGFALADEGIWNDSGWNKKNLIRRKI